MKRLLGSFVLFAAIVPAFAATLDGGAATPEPSRYVFSLLPRSLVTTPRLDVSVFGELTARGRKLREVSPAHPMHYVAVNGGYRGWGLNVPLTFTPTEPTFERMMEKTLGDQGYLPADRAHPAALCLVYQWGAHFHPMRNLDRTAGSPEQIAFDRLECAFDLVERAALLGGEAFAREFANALTEMDDTTFTSFIDGEIPATGSTMALLQARHPRGDFLVNSVNDSLYFIVVSAYNAAEFAKGRKELLWRTRIAVTAAGLSLVETLPQLALAAAPHVGRDTGDGLNVDRRFTRGARIEYGDLAVVSWGEADAPARAGTVRQGPTDRKRGEGFAP